MCSRLVVSCLVAEYGLKSFVVLNLMARWRDNPAGAGDGAEGENARLF
jgi:hypothetical protein